MINSIKAFTIGTVALIGSWFSLVPESQIQPINDRVNQLESQLESMSLAQDALVLGAYNTTGGGTYRLKAAIGLSDTTIQLSSFKEPVSLIPYTMSYLNSSIIFATIEPQTTHSEFISFTGITQNSDGSASITGVTRGLTRTPQGSACTASTTLAQRHSGQSGFIISDSPCHFAQYAVKSNDETITGQWTFNVFPVTPATPYASSTAFGITKLSIDPAVVNTPIAAAANNTYSGTVLSVSNKIIDTRSTSTFPGFVSNASTTFTAKVNLATTTATTTMVGSFPAYWIGKNTQVITTTGTSTFTVPSGINKVYVRLTGAGGAATGSGGADGAWTTFGTGGYFFYATGGKTDGNTGGIGVNGNVNISGGRGQPAISSVQVLGGTNPLGPACSSYGSGGGSVSGSGSGSAGGYAEKMVDLTGTTTVQVYVAPVPSSPGSVLCNAGQGLIIINW